MARRVDFVGGKLVDLGPLKRHGPPKPKWSRSRLPLRKRISFAATYLHDDQRGLDKLTEFLRSDHPLTTLDRDYLADFVRSSFPYFIAKKRNDPRDGRAHRTSTSL